MRTKGGYRAKQPIKHSAPPKGIQESSNCSWDPSLGLLSLGVLAGELDWPLRRVYSFTEEALRCSSDYPASKLILPEFSLTFLLITIDNNNLDTPKHPSWINRFFKCQRAQALHDFSDEVKTKATPANCSARKSITARHRGPWRAEFLAGDFPMPSTENHQFSASTASTKLNLLLIWQDFSPSSFHKCTRWYKQQCLD